MNYLSDGEKLQIVSFIPSCSLSLSLSLSSGSNEATKETSEKAKFGEKAYMRHEISTIARIIARNLKLYKKDTSHQGEVQ